MQFAENLTDRQAADAVVTFAAGPRGDEPGFVPLALLWAFPVVLLFLGILWWLLAQFLR